MVLFDEQSFLISVILTICREKIAAKEAAAKKAAEELRARELGKNNFGANHTYKLFYFISIESCFIDSAR